MLPMLGCMSADEQAVIGNRVDAAFRVTGLLVRAIAYAGIAALADRYDFGRAILTGVLAGDLLSRLLALTWELRECWIAAVAELAVLGVVFLFVRPWLVWPDDPASRALVGLAGFGVLAGQVGSTVFTRLGPHQDGFT